LKNLIHKYEVLSLNIGPSTSSKDMVCNKYINSLYMENNFILNKFHGVIYISKHVGIM